MKRSFKLGALVAPPVASLGYVAVISLLPDPTPKGDRTLEAMLVALVVFFVPVSYAASFVFGLPLIYFLRRLNKLSLRWLVVSAAPLGVVASTLCLSAAVLFFDATVLWNKVSWKEVAGFICGSAAYGAAIAAIFWWVAGIPKKTAL